MIFSYRQLKQMKSMLKSIWNLKFCPLDEIKFCPRYLATLCTIYWIQDMALFRWSAWWLITFTLYSIYTCLYTCTCACTCSIIQWLYQASIYIAVTTYSCTLHIVNLHILCRAVHSETLMHHNIFRHDMNTCIHSKDNCDKCDIAVQKKVVICQ